jgi:GNAT superfamily N-acetyltransferase
VILNDDLTYRVIHMDGRELEANPAPSWMGYSVGRWDGDTLVVNSAGFNDKTWLNDAGLPHTEALRVTERYRRRDVGHLEMEVTYTDPATYAKPWGFSANMALAADTEMLEAVCERSSEQWAGTVSDAAKSAVIVAPEMLARYVGVYSGFWGGNKRTVEVSLSGGQLIVKIPGGTIAGDESRPLVPLSQTLFEGLGLGYQFIVDDKGVATDVVEVHISGPYRYARQP